MTLILTHVDLLFAHHFDWYLSAWVLAPFIFCVCGTLGYFIQQRYNYCWRNTTDMITFVLLVVVFIHLGSMPQTSDQVLVLGDWYIMTVGSIAWLYTIMNQGKRHDM